MNRLFKPRFLVTILSMMLMSSTLVAQIDDFDILKTGLDDAASITKAYITPWANAFGAGASGSWYNTAKPHKFGGFDITFGLNVGIVPSSDNTYDVSKIGLKNFTGTGMAPTVSGPDEIGPALTSKPVSGIAPISFYTPKGANWRYVPVPSLQAGIGLPMGSELKLRFVPRINFPGGDGDISLWGIGFLHSIMQYVKGNDLLPFDVSVFGGFTKLTGNVALDVQPDSYADYSGKYNAGSFSDQNFELISKAWNASAIASFNLPVITLYGGLGYTGTTTDITLTGNYPMPTINPAISTTTYVYEDAGVVNKFPSIDIKNYSGLRANAGFRLKFAVITWHVDYTWAQYNIVSTGLGISFR